MQITVGKTAGFCFGVKRAVEGANSIKINPNEKYFGLGEIVHNKQVVNKLSERGIKFIEDIKEAQDNVIIRAHGVPKEIYEQAKKININVIDYTCPKVIKVHEIADQYSKLGYYIILFGDKNHPENIGTISYSGNEYSVINEEKEIDCVIENIINLKKDKVLIISQTTYNMEKFMKYSEKIKENLKDKEIIIKNTVCETTQMRQKETEEIAKNNDCMIIVGGKNSSNTQKLYEVAKKYCKNTVNIETEKELNLDEICKYEKIGIMAGASTPNETINNICRILKNSLKYDKI